MNYGVGREVGSIRLRGWRSGAAMVLEANNDYHISFMLTRLDNVAVVAIGCPRRKVNTSESGVCRAGTRHPEADPGK